MHYYKTYLIILLLQLYTVCNNELNLSNSVPVV